MSALKVIELRSENVLHLSLEEIRKITTNTDISDRSLVVLSIAGAMRKGKSFLLNFFLTYAYNKYGTTKTIAHPKTFENGSLIDGFSHCGGTERHTTGIQVWPDIFLHDYPDGKKIAIIFMDTQGTFDYESKFSDCVSIFALSTLLSSIQIYNISHNIQNDHLQYLALFVEYAKLALDQITSSAKNTKPFDNLQILVRDWNFPLDADYGLSGGKKILEKIFSSSNSEVQKTVSIIKDKFKTIECFLMPFPGEAIATTHKFDGTIANVDKIFLEKVAFLTAHLLSPESLQIKKIDGVELKVGNFVDLIEQGFEILSKYENIPKPQTIVAATAESQSFRLIADTIDVYKNLMAPHLEQYLENAEFMQLHEQYFNESLEFYDNANKMETFDAETDEKWKAHIEEMLMRECNYYLIKNEKNQPDTSEALQTLIKVVTEQKDMIKDLNERHAQDMLDLINTFRHREDENREYITELIRQFKQSPKSGFDFKYPTTKTIPHPKTLPNSPLIDGFSHRGGTERHTTGIQVWPDIFLHDYPDGKKIAIIFMDTQGTFDYETKFSDCVSIFAISTVLSSIQIYNINHNIQNDHLQYLALFVEYAKLALNQITSTPECTQLFQTLQILVRDWNFPYQMKYGLAGGTEKLDKIFLSRNSEVQQTVKNIKDAFKTIECFLMPYPGDAVATTPKFDGNIEDVDITFLANVASLNAHFLSPENLKIKVINGVELKVKDFVNLIERSFEILTKYENIPKPKTIIAATAESHSFQLIAQAVDIYKNSMEANLVGKKCLNKDEFVQLHEKYFEKAMKFFENADKLETFDSETDENLKSHLEDMLMRESNYYLIRNEKYQPKTSQALQELINAVTEQTEMIKDLNARHAQDMLDLINTFRQHEEQHREHISEMTRQFKESPADGYDFMNILVKMIDLVPAVVTTLGLHRTAYGRLAITGCSVGRAMIGQ